MNKVECYYDEEYDEWQRLEEQKSLFISHEEARALMNNSGLKELAFCGVENILTAKEKEINQLEESEYKIL